MTRLNIALDARARVLSSLQRMQRVMVVLIAVVLLRGLLKRVQRMLWHVCLLVSVVNLLL